VVDLTQRRMERGRGGRGNRTVPHALKYLFDAGFACRSLGYGILRLVRDGISDLGTHGAIY